MDQADEQEVPSEGGRKSLPWQRDPLILQRMVDVERRHLAGDSNVQIAAALGVNEATIRRDLERLRKLWTEWAAEKIEDMRNRVVRGLLDVKRRALAAAEFDEAAERAVLYGDVDEDEPNVTDLQGQPVKRRVIRDDKGSVTFRGNKSGALNVARQAEMDIAKVMGLIVEKQESTGELLVRIYERGGPAALPPPDTSETPEAPSAGAA